MHVLLEKYHFQNKRVKGKYTAVENKNATNHNDKQSTIEKKKNFSKHMNTNLNLEYTNKFFK